MVTYNSKTGETIITEDVEELPTPIIEEPTIEERLQAAEEALLTLISLGGL
jgi:hypothetical protein